MFGWFKKKKEQEPLVQEELQHNFNDHIAKEILQDIKSEFGLDYAKQEYITMRKIERFAIKESIYDFNNLKEQLARSPKLKEQLINMLTVGETYFYREKGHLAITQNLVKNKQIRSILCAPCSSGEEVYSIALILKSAGISQSVHITGIDLNSDAITYAKHGCYSKRSLTYLPQEIINRYFTQEQERFCIDSSLKVGTEFFHQNIFDESLSRLGSFDVIFCRNMLIYFDEEQKKDVIARLRKLLVPNGYLFVAHADIAFIPEGFKKVTAAEGNYFKLS